jgi:hypothetical protein
LVLNQKLGAVLTTRQKPVGRSSGRPRFIGRIPTQRRGSSGRLRWTQGHPAIQRFHDPKESGRFIRIGGFRKNPRQKARQRATERLVYPVGGISALGMILYTLRHASKPPSPSPRTILQPPSSARSVRCVLPQPERRRTRPYPTFSGSQAIPDATSSWHSGWTREHPEVMAIAWATCSCRRPRQRSEVGRKQRARHLGDSD